MALFATDLSNGDVFGPFVVTTDADGQFCERVNQARPTRWKVDLLEPGSGFTDSKVITVFPSVPDTTTTVPGQTTTTTVPGQTTTTTASTTTTSTTLPPTTTTTPPTTTTTTTTSTTTTSTTLPPTTATTAPTTTVPGQTTTGPASTVPGQTTTTAAAGQTTSVAGQTTTTAAATTTTVPGQTSTTVGATTSVPEEDLGFEVEPVPVPPEGVLPATGSDVTPAWVVVAFALLAVGGVASLAVRTRRPRRL